MNDVGEGVDGTGPLWRDANTIDRFSALYGLLVLFQFITVALYEGGMLTGHVAMVAGLATSLGGPALGFLASAHTLLHRRISKRRSILAAVLAYMSTCLSFAVLYLLVADSDPHAFTAPQTAPTIGLGTALYFSVITITTTGYGDISPLSALARVTACWEIVTGLLFQIFNFSMVASLLLPAPRR